MPTPKKKELLLEDVVEGSMQKMKESMNKDINNENKLSYLEKEIRKEKLSNKEKPIKEKYLEKVLTTDRPTEERIEKGKKGKSSKRKGKKSKDAGRKMPPLPSSQSIDQQNNLEKNETNEDLLTSPCSTVSSPPALPPSCSSSTSFPQALVRRDEQSARQNSSSIGRMIGRWRHTTGGIQLRNITLSGVWEKLALGIRSDGREAFRTSSVQLGDNRRLFSKAGDRKYG
uniref:Uncharacterized protein n=1 Tax=Meloidogyne incognita TaxID=6306 RepID=A0A914NFK9_MELIC